MLHTQQTDEEHFSDFLKVLKSKIFQNENTDQHPVVIDMSSVMFGWAAADLHPSTPRRILLRDLHWSWIIHSWLTTVSSAGSCTPETWIPGTRTEVQLRADWELDSRTHGFCYKSFRSQSFTITMKHCSSFLPKTTYLYIINANYEINTTTIEDLHSNYSLFKNCCNSEWWTEKK